MINLKVRFKNPVFIAQLVMAIIVPILTYFGLTIEDMNSWSTLGKTLLDAISNPYVIATVIVSAWNAINDPTTSGISDSEIAMTYTKPKK